VERTRGGPQQGKRTTMLEPERKGDVGEQEREFLTRLDRSVILDSTGTSSHPSCVDTVSWTNLYGTDQKVDSP